MVALESGPFELFKKFGEHLAGSSLPGWVREGVACPLCLSLYFSLPFTAFVSGCPFVAVWLGLSGAASFLYLTEKQ